MKVDIDFFYRFCYNVDTNFTDDLSSNGVEVSIDCW